jgi:hypothetical protein
MLPGVAVVPAATLALAAAGFGYKFEDYYSRGEKDSRAIITELVGLDSVLRRTEEGLVAHETTMTFLMEEIKAVMMSVNKSETRFQHIHARHQFSEREIQLLSSGVNRVKDSVALLASRYQHAMDNLFRDIVQSANALPADDSSAETNPQLPRR